MLIQINHELFLETEMTERKLLYFMHIMTRQDLLEKKPSWEKLNRSGKKEDHICYREGLDISIKEAMVLIMENLIEYLSLRPTSRPNHTTQSLMRRMTITVEAKNHQIGIRPQ